MIEKIREYLYENNVKKINEIIDEVNTMTLADTQGTLSTIRQYLNSLVSSVKTGTTDGTISVKNGDTTVDVPVKGLKSGAFTDRADLADYIHKHSSDAVYRMTGYVKANTATAISTSDTLNTAVGKLEKSLDEKLAVNGTAARATADSSGNVISSTYVLLSSVGNEANKIPRYDAEGHLVLPDGTEVYSTDDEVGIPNSGGEPTHFIGINSSDSTDTNYNGGGAVGVDSIAIGKETVANGEGAIAIGQDVNIDEDSRYGGIVIGNHSYARETCVAIGYSVGTGNDSLSSIAIGNAAVTDEEEAIAIGYNTYATSKGSISIGNNVCENHYDPLGNGENNIVIGNSVECGSGKNNIIIGTSTESLGENAIVLGKESLATRKSSNSVVIGTKAKINADEYTAEDSIAIGSNALVDESSSNSIAIGTNTKVNCSDSIAIGSGTECHGSCSIAIGDNTKVYDDYCDFSVAIGHGAEVTAENAIAIGPGAKVDYVLDGIAIGQGAQVIGGDNCVAIGNESVANEYNEFSIGKPAQNGPYGNHSEFTRRITHVSNGINDSDAVTLGQVKAMIAALRQELRSIS